MRHHQVPFGSTGYFSAMMRDYLDQTPTLQPFYHRFPTLENLRLQASEKAGFSPEKRRILSQALSRQYSSQGLPVPEEVALLLKPNTFTVTTGHQLCLFTGPLYFIYKLVTAVNLAAKMKREYPDLEVLPVYWMATEDHDFEEVNHIHLEGKRISWIHPSGGAVGHLDTNGIEELIEEIRLHLPASTAAEELLEMFRTAYAEPTLAAATRKLVHLLFPDTRLVVVDGDDPELKAQFTSVATADLFDQLHFKTLRESNAPLEEAYHLQAMVREVNLFYLDNEGRDRLERRGDEFRRLGSAKTFTRDEIKKELETHPERFSPNVILRPLYQEMILPNLCYIGGGGELAYWFQLKPLFDLHRVPFPILLLRNSVLWVPHNASVWAGKEGITAKEMFLPVQQLLKSRISANAPVNDLSFSAQEEQLRQLFAQWEDFAALTDKSMLGAVKAQQAKQLKGFENLRKKFLRAEKRRQAERTERITRFRSVCFPGEKLQERHDNFSSYYARYGRRWLEVLLEELDPLALQFSVLEENEPLS